MKKFFSVQNSQTISNLPINSQFIQKVINLSFLIFMIGVLTSFFTKPESTAVEKTARELAVEPYIGEIAIFPYSFAPQGWARCDGQLIPIAQNSALFALIGTTFGGNGTTTFALPDLRGRTIIHNGSGPGLPNYVLGQQGGTTNTVLSVGNLPAHNHTASGTVRASSATAEESDPSGKVPAAHAGAFNEDDNVSMKSGGVNVTVNNTGSGQQFTNMQPYLTVGYYIALTGVFPSQN